MVLRSVKKLWRRPNVGFISSGLWAPATTKLNLTGGGNFLERQNLSDIDKYASH